MREKRARLRREKDAKIKAMQAEADADRLAQLKEAKNALADVHSKGLQTQEEIEAETVKLVSVGTGDEESAKAKIAEAENDRKTFLEKRREEMKKKQAAYLDKMAAEKERFMRELDQTDVVAEDEAEKKRMEALMENGLFDENEQAKEAEKNKDPAHSI